jgi:hypothetical protein
MESSVPVAEPPKTQSPTPVMDVTPPQTSSDQIATPPPEEEEIDPKPKIGKSDKSKAASKKKEASPKVSKPKNESQSPNTAIFATLVIVLALAAMATYAYIKTK